MWIDGVSSRLRRHRKAAAGALALFLAGGLLVFLLWPETPSGPPEVTRDQLEMRDKRLCLLGETRPYSGLLVESYGGITRRKSALPLEDGLIHGVVRGWHENGQVEVEEHFVKGVSHGLRTRWRPDGEKRSETEVVNGQLNGRHTEWHENGEKAVEMTMVDGKAEGVVEAWHPDGTLKSRTVMKHGEIREQKFFSSTEPAASGRAVSTNR